MIPSKRLQAILLAILFLFFMSCDNEDENITPIMDLTKNVMYIDGEEYNLTSALISYDDYINGEHNYGLFLYSDGFVFNGDEFDGQGDFIAIEFVSETWDGPSQKIHELDDIIVGINFSASTWQNDHFYGFEEGTLDIIKEDGIYEFTIEAIGTEYDDEQEKVIKSNVELKAHYKGSSYELNFPTEDPSACQLDMESFDYTFGIDYNNPSLYITPGEQSDLNDEYVEEIRAVIGTPSNDITGILSVCNWVNANFVFENAGGANAYIKTANQLYEEKKVYGCHTQSLIISSILREFGFPAIMIETADIEWAYQARDDDVDFLKGHVMSEIYLNNKWILLDNNCSYVNAYDPTNPYIEIPFTPDGLFVFGKGIDIWSYSNNNDEFTGEGLWHLVEHLTCYEPLFNTVNYNWAN